MSSLWYCCIVVQCTVDRTLNLDNMLYAVTLSEVIKLEI